MKKNNFLLLGMAFTMITLAIMQYIYPIMLPMSLYIFIGWASLEITLCELMKSLLTRINNNNLKILSINKQVLDMCKRSKEIYKRFNCFQEEFEKNDSYENKIQMRIKQLNTDKKVKRIEKVYNIVAIIETLVCFIQLGIMYVIQIPNDINANKELCILSLLSFAFLLISFFITRGADNEFYEINEHLLIENRLNEYYLGLLEKLAYECSEPSKTAVEDVIPDQGKT